MVSELKACPFCGEVEWLKIHAGCCVRCASCCADGPVYEYDDDADDPEAKIIELWNQRSLSGVSDINAPGWKQARILRASLAAVYCGGVFSVSKMLGGTADQQPWWGVALTLILGVAAPLFAWHNYRVMERDDG